MRKSGDRPYPYKNGWPRARKIMGYLEQGNHFGSDAFPLEHLQNISEESLYRNIESYLGEYRFSIPRYEYELYLMSDKSGAHHIVDPYDGECMTIKARRAIKKQEDMWKNASREIAEYNGLVSLEEQICTAPEGSMVVWTSPPGAPEDGYGGYGFFFLGKVHASEKSKDEKKIVMTAYRIDNLTIDQCSRAISQLTSHEVCFQTAEECIAHPKIIQSENARGINSLLGDVFNFTCDFESEQLFKKTMKILQPSIYSFIGMVHNRVSKNQVQQAFYALENYAISLRRIIKEQFYTMDIIHRRDAVFQEVVPFHLLVNHFGFSPPPAVAGSCGSTAVKSANLFNNSLSSLISLFSSEQSEDFECPNPKCKKKSTPPVGDSCPQCGITKDEAKSQGLTTC